MLLELNQIIILPSQQLLLKKSYCSRRENIMEKPSPNYTNW